MIIRWVLVALVREAREGRAGKRNGAVWHIKNQIDIQFGRPIGLRVTEHVVGGFDREALEKDLENEDYRAVVCMGRDATQAFAGYPSYVGSVREHSLDSGRKIFMVTTLKMLDFEGNEEENSNSLNLVKIHLHQLAKATGLVPRV